MPRVDYVLLFEVCGHPNARTLRQIKRTCGISADTSRETETNGVKKKPDT